MDRFIFVLILAMTLRAHASSCCGSSAAVPGLITTGEKVKFNLSQNQSQVIGDVANDGQPIFRKSTERTLSQGSILQLSFLMNESWQMGFSTSAVANKGAGDTSVFGAWEAYPEGSLEDKGLRGIYFSKLLIPTGRSVYEIDSGTDSQITGQGFFNLGLGTLWVLRRWDWDYNASAILGQNLQREFVTSTGRLTVLPSQNAEFNIGAGYSWKNWRGGVELGSIYRFPRQTQTTSGAQIGDESYWWPVTLSGSYFMANSSFLQMSYVDETVLGPVKNCSLSRILAFSYSYRFF